MTKFKLPGRLPLCIIAFLLLLASQAWSDSPIMQVKSAVDEAVKILSTPQLGGETERKERHRLLRSGDEWKIYDVVVEDISLVNNYRSQFNRVINESSYEELVSRIRGKLLKSRGE